MDINVIDTNICGNFLLISFQTLALNLQLDPEEIKALASKIDATVSQLENVDTIIQNTRSDLSRVNNLKDVAQNSRFLFDDF